MEELAREALVADRDTADRLVLSARSASAIAYPLALVRAGRVLPTLVRLAIFRYYKTMAVRSIDNIEKKRKRGRPPTEATPVLVRVMPDQIERLDAWIVKQGEPHLGRPEAIRRLLDKALPPVKSRQMTRSKLQRKDRQNR